jgi:hypothetical protein
MRQIQVPRDKDGKVTGLSALTPAPLRRAHRAIGFTRASNN